MVVLVIDHQIQANFDVLQYEFRVFTDLIKQLRNCRIDVLEVIFVI